MKSTVAVLCLLLFLSGCDQSHTAQTGQTLAPQAVQPKLYTSTIDPAFTVPKLGEKSYKLNVPAGATNVRVQGRFNVTGGKRNDIEVALMNDDEFVNRRNGHPVTPIYNSQKVTQDTVNVSLPSDAGVYYLVFDNRFSFISPKAVQDSLTLQYMK